MLIAVMLIKKDVIHLSTTDIKYRNFIEYLSGINFPGDKLSRMRKFYILRGETFAEAVASKHFAGKNFRGWPFSQYFPGTNFPGREIISYFTI